jgi:hypothetical protein
VFDGEGREGGNPSLAPMNAVPGGIAARGTADALAGQAEETFSGNPAWASLHVMCAHDDGLISRRGIGCRGVRIARAAFIRNGADAGIQCTGWKRLGGTRGRLVLGRPR